VLPIFLRWQAPAPSSFRTHLAIDFSYFAALSIGAGIVKAEFPRMGKRRAISLVVLIFLLNSVTNQVHNFNVDRASNYAPPLSNEFLQEHLQDEVVRLSPAVVPHSYRFLPNALVYCLQLCGVRFDAARDIYRLLTGLLLFYCLYRFARLYTDVTGAILSLMFACAIYPISFEWYIDQLTDPLSQLSLVLAFIFLETDNFACLLTTLLLGSLAKETVLALCGFYLLFKRNAPDYLWKTLVLCFGGTAAFVIVRILVLHGGIHYEQISGPGPSHVIENWWDTKWLRLFLLSGGSYLPFLALGWKDTPVALRKLACYLLPVLLVSSLFFSWLSETRNWMPAVFVLAVITGRYWSRLGEANSATYRDTSAQE
jgi:hypothetical protein